MDALVEFRAERGVAEILGDVKRGEPGEMELRAIPMPLCRTVVWLSI